MIDGGSLIHLSTHTMESLWEAGRASNYAGPSTIPSPRNPLEYRRRVEEGERRRAAARRQRKAERAARETGRKAKDDSVSAADAARIASLIGVALSGEWEQPPKPAPVPKKAAPPASGSDFWRKTIFHDEVGEAEEEEAVEEIEPSRHTTPLEAVETIVKPKKSTRKRKEIPESSFYLSQTAQADATVHPLYDSPPDDDMPDEADEPQDDPEKPPGSPKESRGKEHDVNALREQFREVGAMDKWLSSKWIPVTELRRLEAAGGVSCRHAL